MTDALLALLACLGADDVVKGLVGSRVWGLEVPRTAVETMPRQAIVVRPAGGPSGVESGTYADLTTGRFDVWNYGETQYDARQLQLASYAVLKRVERDVFAGILVHAAERVGGPLPIIDPVTNWPISVETFEVLTSDVAIT